MDKMVYVIDIETDHLEPDCGSIVEIGIVSLNLESGKIIPMFNSVVRERGYIYKQGWIFENSSLLYEEVRNAPRLNNYYNRLQRLFSKAFFTAFNQKFDFEWLESRDFEFPFKWLDPMLILTPIMKLPHHYYTNKYPSVEEAYFFLFEEKIKEPHRALEDATIEARIIRKMIEKKYILSG